MKKITDYTNENNEHVLSVIKEIIKFNEKDYFFGEHFVFIAYMMYMIKTKWKDKTENECYESFFDYGVPTLHAEIKEVLDRRIKWDDFVKIAESLSEDELADFIMTYQDSKYKSDPAQFCILELVDRILDIKENDNVFEYASNDAEFAYYSLQKHPDADYLFCAVDMCYVDLFDAKTDLLGLNGSADWDDNFSRLMLGDPFPDKVFVNYKLDTDWSDYAYSDEIHEMLQTVWPEYSGEFTSPICLAGIISAVIHEEGRAVMLVNAGHLSGSESEEARRILVEDKNVKGVIALPNKMYLSTWTNVYLLVLERNSKHIRFCDAREIYQKGRVKGKQVNTLSEEDIQLIYNDFIKGLDFTKTVSIKEVKENDYSLLPQRYAEHNINKYEKTVPFENMISKIERGITLSASDIDKYVTNEVTSEKCITPSCLSNGIIMEHKYFDIDNFSKKINKAGPGDILINKAGTPFRVAVADDYYVVVGNIYIVGLNKDKRSYYIKGFLESPAGQMEMEKYTVGSAAKIISVQNLQKIQIPIFDENKMNRIEKEVCEVSTNLKKAVEEQKTLGELYV